MFDWEPREAARVALAECASDPLRRVLEASLDELAKPRRYRHSSFLRNRLGISCPGRVFVFGRWRRKDFVDQEVAIPFRGDRRCAEACRRRSDGGGVDPEVGSASGFTRRRNGWPRDGPVRYVKQLPESVAFKVPLVLEERGDSVINRFREFNAGLTRLDWSATQVSHCH